MQLLLEGKKPVGRDLEGLIAGAAAPNTINITERHKKLFFVDGLGKVLSMVRKTVNQTGRIFSILEIFFCWS
jgi:hypothetical protein